MVDVFEVANLLVSHAVETYGNDVDLIAYYGSQARGDARPGSDLDLFYTPADGKNPPIRRTFLLDGLLFDFWELRWEILEGFATGNIRGWAFAPALVRQATPLYVRSSQQADRLAMLQRQSQTLEGPANRSEMQERAQDSLIRVVERLGSLHLAAQGRRADVSYAAWQLISTVWECLALTNRVTFERGLHKALAETERLTSRPATLVELVNTISTSPFVDQVLHSADELVTATHRVVQAREPSRP
ncbi:nucleotidyltransferase domain-containing protein, partial [Candidatus Bipolaricaulota bacterium]|nr:nucleotidyltransferase domain-containing protein [Candidatus Bipolaricaulota bacterium]